MQQSPIDLDDVWKWFGINAAVRAIGLDMSPQSVFGFLEPNGAGSAAILAAGTVVEGFGLHWHNHSDRSHSASHRASDSVSRTFTRRSALGESSIAFLFGCGGLRNGGKSYELRNTHAGWSIRRRAWPQYFPWSLPMLVLSRDPQNVEATLIVSFVRAVGVAISGCLDSCRREVT